MTIEGRLEGRGLGQVLSALARADRTGILTVQGPAEIIALSFLEGEIVSADALNLTLEDGLGAVLADLQIVSAEDFAGLAAEHQAGGGRVGELLVERGYLARRQLLGAIRVHTYRLCRDVLAWSEGEYKFYQGEEVSYEPGVTPLPVPELMYRVSRDLAGREFPGLSYPQPSSIYARSPTAFEAGGRGSRGGEAEPPAVVELGAEASELFSRLDGATSAAGLAENTGLDEHVVAYLLYRLERQQAIELVGSEAPPPPEVRPIELPDPPVEPEPRPPRTPWSERLVRLRPRLPSADERLYDWAARLAGGVLMLWVAVYLAGTVAGRLPPLVEPELPPTAHAGLRRAIGLDGVHRGARIFFLLYGRYPETLEELYQRGLLTASPADAPTPPDYSATAVSYVVSVPRAGRRPGATQTGTIAGNFLLDPDFAGAELTDQPPLVLLD